MNTPTKITVSRIVLVVTMLISLLTLDIINSINPYLLYDLRSTIGNSHVNITGLIICIVFIVAASTDALDGYLARKNNQVTDLGKFLDPVADKLLVNSLLIYLCFKHSYLGTNTYIINFWFVLIMIIRDIVVDSLRFIAASKKVVIAANGFGKAKTIAQMITIPLVLLNGWPFSYFDLNLQLPSQLRVVSFFVYITTALSVISGVIYVIQNRNVLKDGSKKSNKSSK